MKSNYLKFLTILFSLVISMQGIAEELKLVPTFENCSVYVEKTGNTAASMSIEYKASSSNKWLKAQPLVSSVDNKTPRCSIFNLTQNTKYDVRCLKQGTVIGTGSVTTWSDDVPIAKTIKVNSSEPFLVEQSGSPEGWILYTTDKKDLAIDGGYYDEEAILAENVSYIIFDGLKVRGGKRHGFQIKKSHHIRIRNCDIAGFGRKGEDVRNGRYYEPGGKKPNNWDAGVYIDLGEQIVVENNFIHDPRGQANSWAYGHPLGPNGVFVRADEKGGIVIRYNDIIGSADHRWNDTIEAYGNGKPHGGFRCDSDIYGNYLAYSNDDAIELDGGQRNVRFYGNKLEGSLCGISTAANLIGPCYAFNNLVVNLGEDRGFASACVKNGGGTTSSKGINYFYNNTFFSLGRGITGVGFGRDKNKKMFHGVSRNNILIVSSAGLSAVEESKYSDFDYDMFANVIEGRGSYDTFKPMEKNAIFADPEFANPLAGDFRLKKSSKALKAGAEVPGLYPKGCDMGALQQNGPYAFMPWRKIGIIANKYQVLLKNVKTGSSKLSDVVMLKGTTLKKPAAFTIQKNSNFSWLNISPAKGIIKPGQIISLKVAMDPAKANHTFLPGGFVVKLESGESLPVTVYGKVLKNEYKKHFKAVDCKGADTFKKDVVDGLECLKFFDHRNEGITMTVNVPDAGEYYIYYNVKCPKPYPMHDSIFVSINGSELERCAINGSDNWHWERKSGKVSYVALKKGENVIKVAQREAIYLESVFVTSQPVFAGEKISK